MKPLTIGDPQQFAIESCITQAYARLSLRALGYFLIHVGGCSYGVRSSDATMLACSFDQVGRRILQRGKHSTPFSSDADAVLIATAVFDAIYSAGDKVERPFGIPWPHLREVINTQQIQWAPDGDEAFDDDSRILQFDVNSRVRIVAYKLGRDNGGRHRPDPDTLRDHWMDADEFYGVLQKWRDDFETEWLAASKVSEKNGIREAD